MPFLRHADHEIGLRDRRIGQSAGRSQRAVLSAKLFDGAELNRTLRAGFDADGLSALFKTIKTGIALRHLVRLFVQTRRTVGTGAGAHAAADALFSVDHDEAVLGALVMLLHGTDLDAGRIRAMVAGDAEVAGAHVLFPGTVGILLPAALHELMNGAEIAADRQIVRILAGDDAGLAAGALRRVNEKSKLFCHVFFSRSGLADFNEVGVLGIALRERTRTVARQRVDAAADVNRTA